MAKTINVSKAASCAEYFSLSKCTKVVNVSMEQEGKESANVHLKTALGVVGKEKFDLTCVTTVGDKLFMGYRDYTDTVAVRDGKEIVYTEEVRVNRNGEEYTVHCVDFDDEDEPCAGYYEGKLADGNFVANGSQWDGRTWKSAKEIEGAKRYTPKDCVKGFFAKFEGAIRTYNNDLAAQRAAKKAENAAKKAAKAAKEEEAARKEHARMLEVMGMTEEDFQAMVAKRTLANDLNAIPAATAMREAK